MLERQWHGYKEEVKQEFAKTKAQFNGEYKSLLDELHTIKETLNKDLPRLDNVSSQILHLQDQMEKEDQRFEQLQKIIINFDGSKVDLDAYRDD